MEISVSEAHNRLSYWLAGIEGEDITITRRGKPVGVIISPEEYERLGRVRAYVKMLRLSRSLEESGGSAMDLVHASRDELEGRA